MQDAPLAELPAHARLSPYGRALRAASRGLALLGGLVFIALVAMSIVSIVGRKLASMPVPGDVELLQMCAAFASASFFAWCHLNHGDVKVDFFTQGLRTRTVNRLDAVDEVLGAEMAERHVGDMHGAAFAAAVARGAAGNLGH